MTSSSRNWRYPVRVGVDVSGEGGWEGRTFNAYGSRFLVVTVSSPTLTWDLSGSRVTTLGPSVVRVDRNFRKHGFRLRRGPKDSTEN